MAELLEGPATPEAVAEFKSLLDGYAASGAGEGDGEETRDRDAAQPGMLQDDGTGAVRPVPRRGAGAGPRRS